MNEITLLQPEGLVSSPAFSHVAIIPPGTTTIHVGGQNAVDAEGTLVGPDDVEVQTRQVMANLAVALEATGATMADLVSVWIQLVDGVDLQAAYEAAASAFDPGSDPPLVTVALVAGLAVPGALVEVSATAAVLR